jgi:Ca-activated chloride channel family protein
MRRTAKTSIALVILSGVSWADSARSLVARGNRAYERQQYEEALEAYEQAARTRPNTPEVWFNLGNALYQQGDFQAAMSAYEQAAVRSRNKVFEARSKFNEGNAGLRQAMRDSQTNPAQAIEGLRGSVRLYQDALKLDPSLADARHNIEVARRLMKKLEEEQRPQEADGAGDLREQAQDPAEREQQPPESEPGQQAGRLPSAAHQQPTGRPEARSEETVRQILDQERENRRRRLAASGGIRPVDKDW